VKAEDFLKNSPQPVEPAKYSLRAVDELEEEVRIALLRILEKTPKSAAQIRKALIEREHPTEIVDLLIARFVEVGLIDDLALAKEIATRLFERKGKAKSIIASELRQTGFTQEIIQEALEQIDQTDELEAAKALAELKFARMSKLDPDVAQRRLAGFLGRKGYSSSIVWAAVKYAVEQRSS